MNKEVGTAGTGYPQTSSIIDAQSIGENKLYVVT